MHYNTVFNFPSSSGLAFEKSGEGEEIRLILNSKPRWEEEQVERSLSSETAALLTLQPSTKT